MVRIKQPGLRSACVPRLLAAFLAYPIHDVVGEDHLTEIAAYLGRRAAIATLDSMVEGLSLRCHKSSPYGRGPKVY